MEKLEYTELTQDDIDMHVNDCVACCDIPLLIIHGEMLVRFQDIFGEQDAGN